jgi:putative ATP-binding cassette transporter
MGRSGVGKSALLRVFRSMWRAGTGLVHSPNEDEIVFLPQRPYTVHADQGSPLERGSLAHRCSLEAQLLYPRMREIDEAQLQRVLEEVNLPYLAARTGGFKAVFDFGELSPGEQQRLAFARLLLAGPKFAMLDEATSALGEEDENNLYGLLVRYGITPGSVSHRTSLIKHHKYLLELDGDGGYRLSTISPMEQ